VLHVANRSSSGEFQEDDLQLLSGIANQAALAIENAKLYRNIQVEVRRRNNLQRFLSPAAVEQIIEGTRELNLGGEIREVTVLFSDIRGFTSLSEELPPNEVVGMLNEYFNEMSRIIFKHEGTIDKFIGDAIIVVFGAAIQHSDDPLRAVMAAIEMQSSMKKLDARWAAEGRKTFRIGIGIATGDVLYGNVGSEQRMELTVIGDTVNFASRLADIAEGGEILVGGRTWGCLDGSIRGEKTAPMSIQGKTERMEVYRVTPR
jgi:adenylate cyclase